MPCPTNIPTPLVETGITVAIPPASPRRLTKAAPEPDEGRRTGSSQGVGFHPALEPFASSCP